MEGHPRLIMGLYWVIAATMKLKTTIATWNGRKMLQKGKLENSNQEMKRMKINALSISEVR